MATARPIIATPAGSVTVRPVAASDASTLDGFYAGLSAHSQRLRFLGYVPAVGAANVRSLCTPDHEHSEGFVAIDDRDGHLVGHVCLISDEQGTVELAIAVEDVSQRMGVGRRLFEAALGWGQARALPWFTATAFGDNIGMLRLAATGPYPPTWRPIGGGLVRIRIPLDHD